MESGMPVEALIVHLHEGEVPMFGFVVARILPFVTLIVLVWGLVHRIGKWQKAAVANVAVYPAASTRWGLWKQVLGEVVLFSSFRKQNRELWSKTWIFHVTLLLILAGHTRLISDWPLRHLLGMSEGTIGAVSAIGGGLFGIVALAACLLLLNRRFALRQVREISTGEDYYVLILVLMILVTGNGLRFFTHFDVTIAQEYFASLLSLHATKVPHDPLFLLHLFLVQLLLLYLPFGKFLHIPGVFYSKALLAKDF
jgi:nitrate reductase gamma subunit